MIEQHFPVAIQSTCGKLLLLLIRRGMKMHYRVYRRITSLQWAPAEIRGETFLESDLPYEVLESAGREMMFVVESASNLLSVQAKLSQADVVGTGRNWRFCFRKAGYGTEGSHNNAVAEVGS